MARLDERTVLACLCVTNLQRLMLTLAYSRCSTLVGALRGDAVIHKIGRKDDVGSSSSGVYAGESDRSRR